MDRYSLNTTFKCNWDCDYCIVETHKQPERKIEDVYKDIEDLEDGSSISLAGGEPGLLARDQIMNIFDITKRKNFGSTDLLTNGLFIEKYPDLLYMFDVIHYHCVQSLKDDIQFPDMDVDYTIVVTNDELEYLEYFLNKYPNIIFAVIASIKIKPMSIKNMLKMISKFKNRMTQRSISENLNHYQCKTKGY